MTKRLNIVGISGSTGRPSRTLALTQRVIDDISKTIPVNSHIIDVSQIAVPLGSTLFRSDLPANIEQELQRIESADLLVVAIPVYKGGYPGHFKHLFDLIDVFSLVDTPVILAATGGSDRHTLVIEYQLRPLFSFFQALTLPVSIYATAADFTDYNVTGEALQKRISDAVAQLPVVLSGKRNKSVLETT